MNDREIIRLYTQRDETAIDHTDTLYGDTLHRFAARILQSEEDAKECVNDTYQKAWDSIPPAEPDNFAAYLFKICRYTAFGMLDKQHAAKRSARMVELQDELTTALCCDATQEAWEERELERFLHAFLQTLPKDSRMIFMRRYWFADSVQDIAARYHVSESKVKTSLHRTRNKLRDALKREGFL